MAVEQRDSGGVLKTEFPFVPVLRVRPEWLAFGTGYKSREEEVQASIDATARPLEHAETWRKEAARIVHAVTGRTSDPMAPHPYWVAPLYDVLIRRDLVPYEGSDDKQLAALGSALRAPLKALGMTPNDMGPVAFADYVMAMVPVLFGLAAHRSQRTLAESSRREWEASIQCSAEANTRAETSATRAKRKPAKKAESPRRTPATKTKRPRPARRAPR